VPVDITASSQNLAPGAATATSRLARLTTSRPLGLVVKIAISAALIWLVCRNIEIGALAARFAGQSTVWIGAATFLWLVQIGLLTLRWDQVLKGLGAKIAIGTVLVVTYMGCFFNAWLLGTAGGDVVRAMLAPARSLGRAGIVHSVLFDRLTTLAGLGLITAPPILFDLGPLARTPPLLAAFAVVVAAFAGIAAIAWLAPRAPDRLSRVFAALREFSDSWRRLCRAWPHLVAAIVNAALGQVAIAAMAWCLARSLHLDVPFVDFVLLMPPVMLVASLPISVGGWGVREGSMVVALASAGVASASALLISIELGLLTALLSLPGGVLWVYRWFVRPSQPLGRDVPPASK
jgi:uncharacterized membrane protein YbhN (UPF0104 family)